MTDESACPLISLKNIGKSYGGNPVLTDVSIDIMPGEIHAICGENGAGKSTLMNILFGMPVIASTGGYSGKISIDGVECAITSPEQAIARGIGMVHQEFMLLPGFTVCENIKLNREPLRDNIASRVLGRQLKFVDDEMMKRGSRETTDRLGVDLDPTNSVDSLPVGYMQFVEIAREIDKENVRLLILDEPTAVLTESEAEIVLSIVRRLSDMGIAVLLITHRIGDIMAVCDTVTILRDGRNVKTVAKHDTDPGEIARLMVGREVSGGGAARRERALSGDIALKIRDLRVDMPGEDVRGIDLDVIKGEIIGIGGLAGQGKAGIANGIMGVRPASGSVEVFGVPLKLGSPSASIAARMAFVSEDRRRMGFAPDLSIAMNISAPAMVNIRGASCRRVFAMDLVDFAAMDDLARKYIDDFQIKCTGPHQPVGTLSGGNQQKVCVASALALEPEILLVSEPTRGIDVGAKSMVLDTIVRINRERGITVVFTSSELAELRSVCDRIAIVSEGKISAIFEPDASSEAIGLAMAGGGE